MPNAYERIADSFITSDREVKGLFAPPPRPETKTPFVEYYQEKKKKEEEPQEDSWLKELLVKAPQNILGNLMAGAEQFGTTAGAALTAPFRPPPTKEPYTERFKHPLEWAKKRGLPSFLPGGGQYKAYQEWRDEGKDPEIPVGIPSWQQLGAWLKPILKKDATLKTLGVDVGSWEEPDEYGMAQMGMAETAEFVPWIFLGTGRAAETVLEKAANITTAQLKKGKPVEEALNIAFNKLAKKGQLPKVPPPKPLAKPPEAVKPTAVAEEVTAKPPVAPETAVTPTEVPAAPVTAGVKGSRAVRDFINANPQLNNENFYQQIRNFAQRNIGKSPKEQEANLIKEFGKDPEITLYRGISSSLRPQDVLSDTTAKVGRFWSPNPAHAMQFVRGEGDIYSITLKASDLLKRDLANIPRGEIQLSAVLQKGAKKLTPEAGMPALVKPTTVKPAIPKEVIPPRISTQEELEKLGIPPKPIQPAPIVPQTAIQLPKSVSGIVPPAEPPLIPSEPIIKEGGKLFLPEPPRTSAFGEFARKEVKGSFKGKVGSFDTVEEANQMVLKARDMSENTVPYVMSYVSKAGDVMKEFNVVDGLATGIGNPENRSLAINDVLSNFTHYKLNPKQVEIAKIHGFVYKEALGLAKSYGVKINELGDPDELWQYIARRVLAKKDPITGETITPPPSIGGFKMGSKIGAQKERTFEEMMEGVDLGFVYENPNQSLAHYVRGIYRLIGNKQAEDIVTPLTRQITKKEPLEFGERALGQPALKGRASNVEIANAIDKVFTPEQGSKTLKVAADISGAIVGQIAALDLSAPAIQGLPLLGHDIKIGLTGKVSNLWAKSIGEMWKSVVNTKSINDFRTKNADLYKRALEAGVATGQSEFVSGVPLTEKTLAKIPKVGKTLSDFYRNTWGRTGGAYSDFLEVARIKYFEQMEEAWLKNGGNIYDLGALANRMLGSVSSAARGASVNRRYAERIAAFAPNYIRSMFLLFGDLRKGGIKAKEVSASLATLLGIGAIFYYAEEKLRGKEPKMKPWPKRLGGDGAEAFTMEVADQRIGLGSWMYGLLKAGAEVAAIAVDDPGSLLVWDNSHPVARFAKSKMGAGISLVTSLATGRNFYGRKFENAGDYLMRIVESLVPIAGQPLIERSDLGRPKEPASLATALGAQTIGLRSFPYTLLSRWTDDGVFEKYNDIPANDMDRKSKKMPLSRIEYRKKNPEVEAKLFITGIVSTVSTAAAASIAQRLIIENKVDPEEVKGIKINMEDIEEREKLGVPKTTITFTDRLTAALGKRKGVGRTSTGGGQSSPWGDVRPSLDITMLRGLNRLWYKGDNLMPQEEKLLREVHKNYNLGQKDFNIWVKQTLRQSYENSLK